MPPPFPIYRGQGNQFSEIARPPGPIHRGQTVPYDVNGAPSGGNVAWGAITGDIADQTDLIDALAEKLEWVAAPATAASAGTAGQVAYASGFFYICVASNTWQRVAIATW